MSPTDLSGSSPNAATSEGNPGPPHSEPQLRRINRILQTRSACNRCLTRSESEQALLDALCRVLVEEGGFNCAWIGYFPAAGQEPQRMACFGACERAAGGGCPATLALPFEVPELRLKGVLRLYSRDPAAFEDIQGLLEELSDDLAFGIQAHRTRQSLLESEAQFRCLAEDSRQGIYMIQGDRFRYVNPAFADLFGYSVEQIVAELRVGDLVVSEDRAKVAGNLARRLSGELGSLRYEFRAQRQDGSSFLVEVFGALTALKGEAAVVGVLLDISARRETEQRLLMQSRALEASTNGIAISDLSQPDNPFVYVNPAFERITGYCADEVIGRNGRFLLNGDRQQSELGRLLLAMKERRSERVELRNYHKSGSLFWSELSIAPVVAESGQTSHYVSVFNDITERKHYEQQLEQLSNYDALTGLANRNLLKDRLQQTLIYSRRSQRKAALLMITLDRFKVLAQGLDEEAGTAVLKMVAERLSSCVRQGDTVARTGGSEFAIVLQGVRQDSDLVGIVSKLLQSIAQPMPVGVEGMALTASIGVAVWPECGESGKELMRSAGTAMVKAMEQQNCFCYYSPEMNSQAQQRLDLEVQLRQACAQRQFVLFYQPKVDLGSGQITGSEALIRWIHPERGLVPPGDFIPLAEETGLIREIGDWALAEACRQNAAWCQRLGRKLSVAVNLSARQFGENRLVEHIERCLSDSGLPAELLECELTESLLMSNPEEARVTLQHLHALGVRVALDDFGTGYSSLSYLKRFPIDTVKIDRSFVMDIPGDAHDVAITRAVIALSEALSLDVVAEGVETLEQLDFLGDSGCHAMQGFLFSRPLPADEFEALVAREYCLGQLRET